MTETIDRWLDWFQAQLPWMPAWAISLGLLALAVVVARAVHRILFRIATGIVAGKDLKDLFWRSLVSRTEGPTRLAAMIVAISATATIAPLTDGQLGIVRQILLLAFIALLGWVALTALHIWMTVYLRRFTLDAEDNLLARKHVTQTRILRRVAAVLIVMVTLSAALMTFEEVRQYGISLLASAGAAGLVIGLALQPVLKNVFAGIQLAMTQPIRLDDAILVENEWGNVEDITSTYVVVRLWDWRRLVLPLSYFIEKPFQNWTRESSALIGSVFLYLDHTAPVEEMRRKLDEIAKASPLWDRQVAGLQVTDFREQVMEVRILVSARTSGRTFDLRCEVREKMIGWLQQAHPHALPRWRGEVQEAQEAVLQRAGSRG
ncbi:mechanosensitive ion channel family protein [Inquilinus limosus]|uniref:Mechanosensitive ion channel protein MscS n=1 Tax=Inquilinus limosus TaxID=171674 RepID=A0A211ZHC8_9PROT|nr:mechanosensitive ion channel domain-containing protein [Inquilinus limosus]OWJ64678.1 mechanosensitive ion channel protein MscS [Inquilinus limosus]